MPPFLAEEHRCGLLPPVSGDDLPDVSQGRPPVSSLNDCLYGRLADHEVNFGHMHWMLLHQQDQLVLPDLALSQMLLSAPYLLFFGRAVQIETEMELRRQPPWFHSLGDQAEETPVFAEARNKLLEKQTLY